MDILKLLSRSTKRPNKSAKLNNSPAKLPSAGVSANPQLYHDAIPDSRGKKRKRGSQKVEEQTALNEEDEDVDFFAHKPTAAKLKRSKKEEEGDNAKDTIASTKAKLLDQDECRQILKSHRLKITLLPSGKVAEKKVKTSKSGKDKVAKKEKTEETRQLFPQPLMAFGDLKRVYEISGRMAENLVQQGYKIPTEVQMASLPFLLRPDIAFADDDVAGEGQEVDLLAVAPTGSGKTLAFLIPIVDKIIQRRRGKEEKQKGEHDWEALVVVPTKELATQIVNEAKKLSLGTGVKVVGMRKGMRVANFEGSTEMKVDESSSEDEEDDEADEKEKKSSQPQPISKGDILITTPGLLLSALSTGDPNKHAPLPSIHTLVLDEADVLLDPLFKDQTLAIWSSCTSPLLRVTLWSATMGSSIESLAHSTITSRRATLSLQSTPILRLVVGLKDSAIPNITHHLIYAATEPGKLLALRQLLHPTSSSSLSKNATKATPVLRPPFLVFTQTIPRAIALHSELLYDIPSSAGGSSRIAVLHSSLSSTARSAVMTRFRSGEIWILITTDILSRGIDFRGVNGVVNYDVPNSGASYIHRVGRTGRGGREGGVAVTFYTKEDIPYVRDVANIIAASEKQAGVPESESCVQKWLLDMLPKVGKEDKKRLKLHGVEARRGGLERKDDGKDGKGKGKANMQISTKSGYERKLENNRKGAIQGSRRRAQLEAEGGEVPERRDDKVSDDGEWGGIDE